MTDNFYIDAYERLASLFTNMATPALMAIAIILIYRLGVRFEQGLRQSREIEINKDHGSSINNISLTSDKSDMGGFDYIQVPEDFKSIFTDAMNGFRDYAKLKGYSVDISIDGGRPGFIGLKITITDVGVTVSTETVRKDVDEYIKRFAGNDDFSDMPMPQNAVEHYRLISVLQTRFSLIRHEAESYKFQKEMVENFLRNVSGSGLSSTNYAPPNYSPNLQLSFHNDGGKSMRDSYTSSNSQNVAQGPGSQAHTSNSKIHIGNTHKERHQRVEALRAFVKATDESNLPIDLKREVGRYIENAREELESSANVEPDMVEKWLDRARKTISTASAGAELVEKFQNVLELFNLGS